MSWEGDEQPRSLTLPFNLDLFPTTLVVVVAAIGVTIGKEIAGKDVTALVAGYPMQRVPPGPWLMKDPWLLFREPWRFFTTVFPHGGWIHLLFNCMWIVDFGKLIEGRFGSAKTAGMWALFALGSSAAQVGLSGPGIGLSGVLYGCFGFLFVMNRLDVHDLHGRLPRQTEQLLIGWFFLCLILTWTGVMPIGNVAHGYGALMGALTAMVVVSGGKQRPYWLAALVGATVLGVVSCTVAYPYANIDWVLHHLFGG